jgi:hypothetical protein
MVLNVFKKIVLGFLIFVFISTISSCSSPVPSTVPPASFLNPEPSQEKTPIEFEFFPTAAGTQTIEGNFLPGMYFLMSTPTSPIRIEFGYWNPNCLFSDTPCQEVSHLTTESDLLNFDSRLTWSEDGKKAVWVNSNSREVYLYEAETRSYSKLATGLSVTLPNLFWSADGSSFYSSAAFGETFTADIVRTNSTTGEHTRISVGKKQTPFLLGWLDKTHLLFQSETLGYREGSGKAGRIESGLFSLDVLSDQITPVFESTDWLNVYSYALSPNGKTLAYCLDDGVWWFDTQTKETMNMSVECGNYSWSPISKDLAVYNSLNVAIIGEGHLPVFVYIPEPFVKFVLWKPDGQSMFVFGNGKQEGATETSPYTFYDVSLEGKSDEVQIPNFSPLDWVIACATWGP